RAVRLDRRLTLGSPVATPTAGCATGDVHRRPVQRGARPRRRLLRRGRRAAKGRARRHWSSSGSSEQRGGSLDHDLVRCTLGNPLPGRHRSPRTVVAPLAPVTAVTPSRTGVLGPYAGTRSIFRTGIHTPGTSHDA